QDIFGATNSSFTIASPAQADAGSYSVVVSNAFGTEASSNAVLTVDCGPPVSIASQPTNQMLMSGGTIALSVSSSGAGPVKYQLLRGGLPLSRATNSTYTKNNAQPADTDIYAVLVSTCAGGIVSTNAIVTVAGAPS